MKQDLKTYLEKIDNILKDIKYTTDPEGEDE